MIKNKSLESEVIHSCLKLISSKRFEKNVSISTLEVNRILQETITEMNYDLSQEDNYNIYLSIIEELQDYIQD